MTRGRKRILILAMAVLGIVGWLVYGFFHTYAHIPEAYAAWDTGTLLVEYMKSHDNRWPSSWDDLLSVVESEAGRRIALRGGQAGDLRYARSLREKVRVDWNFDPSRPQRSQPVTRLDGAAFPVVWRSAEPNTMVREHLEEHASTRASEGR